MRRARVPFCVAHCTAAIDNVSLLSVIEAGSVSACKNGGWQHLTRADGTTFTNQGDCIQYVNIGK